MKVKFQAILEVGAALMAVERNGNALRYVKEQTEAVCLKAVKQNGDALQYVKEQTEAVCLTAVKNDSYALQYVKDKDLFIKIAEVLDIDIEF